MLRKPVNHYLRSFLTSASSGQAIASPDRKHLILRYADHSLKFRAQKGRLPVPFAGHKALIISLILTYLVEQKHTIQPFIYNLSNFDIAMFREINNSFFSAKRRKIWYFISLCLIAQCILIGFLNSRNVIDIDTNVFQLLVLAGIASLDCLAVCAIFLAAGKAISPYDGLLYWLTLIIIVGGIGYFILNQMRDIALHHPHYG